MSNEEKIKLIGRMIVYALNAKDADKKDGFFESTCRMIQSVILFDVMDGGSE